MTRTTKKKICIRREPDTESGFFPGSGLENMDIRIRSVYTVHISNIWDFVPQCQRPRCSCRRRGSLVDGSCSALRCPPTGSLRLKLQLSRVIYWDTIASNDMIWEIVPKYDTKFFLKANWDFTIRIQVRWVKHKMMN